MKLVIIFVSFSQFVKLKHYDIAIDGDVHTRTTH